MAKQEAMGVGGALCEPVAVGMGAEGFSIDLVTQAGERLMLRMDEISAGQLAALVSACLAKRGTALAA
ncbi:hypothetical protein G3576_20450 [Roseomonas stagni]|uniref:Uncharacterized protein n=1 Tax=Falsiroseomonas algicola TaxID=2716930 RepID=A0A6M1LQZ9_9PROT|nr:hypothetical protein [Falsiroseomonas algicola]NGM22399.1 hypothetical protein [Falsiroseomonas algicola]